MEITSEVGSRAHDAWVIHHERLWRSILAWAGDSAVADDAVAEAFAQAINRGDAINDVGRWVWRAAFRIAGGLLEDRTLHNGGPAVDRPAVGALPGEAAELVEALDCLSKRDRTVVVLALVGGLPSGEIAELTGTSAGNVRVRLFRAKARLREYLREELDG